MTNATYQDSRHKLCCRDHVSRWLILSIERYLKKPGLRKLFQCYLYLHTFSSDFIFYPKCYFLSEDLMNQSPCQIVMVISSVLTKFAEPIIRVSMLNVLNKFINTSEKLWWVSFRKVFPASALGFPFYFSTKISIKWSERSLIYESIDLCRQHIPRAKLHFQVHNIRGISYGYIWE